MLTDNQGQAVARGFRPNGIKGQFQIRVNASHQGQTASASITQTNAVLAASGAAAGAGVSAKLIAVLAIAAGAAAGGAYYATHNGGGTTTAATITPGATIAAGAGTVGPPR